MSRGRRSWQEREQQDGTGGGSADHNEARGGRDGGEEQAPSHLSCSNEKTASGAVKEPPFSINSHTLSARREAAAEAGDALSAVAAAAWRRYWYTVSRLIP